MTIIDLLSPDTYGLLILAPEVPLGSGWLGGDRVVGRTAVCDLLIKAARFEANERERLSIHIPGTQLLFRLHEIESLQATGKSGWAGKLGQNTPTC